MNKYEEFDQYLLQGEPGKRDKAQAWKTAIGLQEVDGLSPSTYLLETAKRHIDGDITIDEVRSLGTQKLNEQNLCYARFLSIKRFFVPRERTATQ